MQNKTRLAHFEQAILPHLDAAYNLARWLIGNEQDAEDMVQESYLRAFKFFDGFHGTDSRAWLLTIVRNTCYTWLQQNRTAVLNTVFDEDIHSGSGESQNSETILLKNADIELLHEVLEELPVEFREALVLREMENLSYKEIALVTRVPVGTVMSRLARARKQLQHKLLIKEGIS